MEKLFAPGPDGRAIPKGRKPDDELATRLVDVGFDLNWLNPGASTWHERSFLHSDNADLPEYPEDEGLAR